MCAKRVGSRSIDSYIFAHAAVAKRALSRLGMHGVVVRGTFCFWRMNPLAGIGVPIARNCSETVKIVGSIARNARFGSTVL